MTKETSTVEQMLGSAIRLSNEALTFLREKHLEERTEEFDKDCRKLEGEIRAASRLLEPPLSPPSTPMKDVLQLNAAFLAHYSFSILTKYSMWKDLNYSLEGV